MTKSRARTLAAATAAAALDQISLAVTLGVAFAIATVLRHNASDVVTAIVSILAGLGAAHLYDSPLPVLGWSLSDGVDVLAERVEDWGFNEPATAAD